MYVLNTLLFISTIPLFLAHVDAQSWEKQRFLHSVFDSVSIQTFSYFEDESQELQMDVYSPQGDTAKHRPVLLYVHGGGFAGGRRDEERYTEFCKTMAKKGYVAITMSYTLVMKGKSFSCDQPAPNKIKTFKQVGQDISRATRYLIAQQSSLKIDTNRIVLLGSSAGAEAVLHAAYWNDTWKDDRQVILPDQFKYAGVVSMAGALVSTDLISVCP